MEAVSPAALLGAAGAVRATQAEEAISDTCCGFTCIVRDVEGHALSSVCAHLWRECVERENALRGGLWDQPDVQKYSMFCIELPSSEEEGEAPKQSNMLLIGM